MYCLVYGAKVSKLGTSKGKISSMVDFTLPRGCRQRGAEASTFLFLLKVDILITNTKKHINQLSIDDASTKLLPLIEPLHHRAANFYPLASQTYPYPVILPFKNYPKYAFHIFGRFVKLSSLFSSLFFSYYEFRRCSKELWLWSLPQPWKYPNSNDPEYMSMSQ